MRVNTAIDLLTRGRVAFGGGFVACGSPEDAVAFAELGYDFVIVDTEHDGFDARGLRRSLQFLLDPAQIAARGTVAARPTPLVRIPANARERNEWFIKQALDQGAYGIVVPHLETVEQARAAVAASRYAQASGAPDLEPPGHRGFSPAAAARYWGLELGDYVVRADLWPLDPDGELLLMPIVESPAGIENLPDILREVEGIGAIQAGPGDLSVGLGLNGDMFADAVEEGVQRILATCLEHDVPCCCVVFGADAVERRIEEGFRLVFSLPARVDPVLAAGRLSQGARAA